MHAGLLFGVGQSLQLSPERDGANKVTSPHNLTEFRGAEQFTIGLGVDGDSSFH
jgi:hypothetical protein